MRAAFNVATPDGLPAFESAGYSWRMRARIPETTAADADVPLTRRYVSAREAVRRSTPGATTSGFRFGSARPASVPIELKRATTLNASTGPTAITPGVDPRRPTGPSS